MKKNLILLMAIMVTMPLFAQSDGEDIIPVSSKKHALFIGPKIGATFTTMTQPDECDLYDGMGMGFSAGAVLKARFGKISDSSNAGTGYFGVGAELMFKTHNVKTIGADEDGKENADLSISYFEVPVYAQVFPFAKTRALNSFYVELGATFAGTVSRSPKSLTVLNPNSELSSITYNIDKDGSKLKGYNISPIIGAGYTVPGTGLDINIRYNIGINELAGNLASKLSTLEVSVAWMFNLSKF